MKTKIQLLLQRLMKTGDGKTIVNDEAKAALDRRTALEETGILAAAIEHDIKTPLAILRLITRRMSDRFASQPDVLRGVEEINQQLHRIYAVVDIVPLLSKGTDFKRQIVKANLCDLVNRCIKDLKQQGATRGVFFRQDQQTFFVSADPGLLQRALMNVILNAAEAIQETGSGRGVIDIHLTTTAEHKELIKLDICDNGCGIPRENLQRLKTIFTTKADKGSNRGIGLLITQRIVATHGGVMEIQSEVGEGTCVSIILPRWKTDL